MDGIASFMRVAIQHVNEKNKTRCPCRKCLNTRWHTLQTVHAHLWEYGMSVVYHTWIYHGEKFGLPRQDATLPNGVEALGPNDVTYDILNDAFPRDMNQDLHGECDTFGGNEGVGEREDDGTNLHRFAANKYEKLMVEAERELFPGTNGLSVLTVMVRLMQAKVENHWTNKSFDILLEILNWACPKPHNLPTTYYATNKMLKNMGLGYENIDACVNDCALFYKEHVGKDKCPECDEPRYKSTSQMRWHFDKRVDEYGVMRHPADSIAWKEFDRMYPEFAQEPRNIRLGLATDGFNPFGSMSTSYSMWPLVVVPYNLPPWMCMKQQYLIMTLLILGPKAPGKDIDVYLRPLIDELQELWEGIPTYDKFTDSGFKMRATVIWTINDFPAHGNLSGWSTKGYLACPMSLEDTSHTKLRNKICYMGHRSYLRKNHPWRKSCDFDGKYEMRDQSRVFSGDEILLQFNHLRPCKPGKHPDNYDRKRKRIPM
ncbi:PREDICTED: transposase [Prunus dulcis]|uniref:PREDICTED: transposase n=1 Tax=Prunus dulcis TaxID=3755 RepID=A0A5E4FXZ8_PRUDU|nr:PREDICTED: transposase [Prunus dulcis]